MSLPYFVTKQRFLLTLLVCLILGILQALAFDFGFDSDFKHIAGLISFVSLTLFLMLIVNIAEYLSNKTADISKKNSFSIRSIFIFGYAYGLGLFGYGVNWIYISLHDFGGANLIFAILANISVVAYLALYWGLNAYLIAKIGKTTKQRLLIAPAVIALLEWVRSVFLIGFPWLSLGYAQINTALAHFSAIGGVWLVSFLIVVLSCLLIFIIKTNIKSQYKISYLLIFSIIFTSLFTIKIIPNFTKNSSEKPVKMALLQGNIDVTTKFDSDVMQQSIVTYMELTDKQILSNNKPDIIIWPETAIPFFNYEVDYLFKDLLEYQNKYHFDLITGIPVYQADTKQIYNGIIHLKQSNTNLSYYYKQHLLPFGEYLPFRFVFDFFKDYVNIPMSDFDRGKVVQTPFVSYGLKFANSICFEIVFGNEIRQNAMIADVLLNISNDGWFGHSKAQEQHLNIARMRTIENQKMLVRATNDGISAIIDNYGNVQNTIAPFKIGAVTGTILGKTGQTPYAKFGDKLVVIAFILIIAMTLLFNLTINRRKK